MLAAVAVLCGCRSSWSWSIATSLGGGGDSGSGNGGGNHAAKHSGGDSRPARRPTSSRYGDTLTSIAHKTGVPVARIRALNPGVDPQILISGETLKLR